jgi:hypothetical protein
LHSLCCYCSCLARYPSVPSLTRSSCRENGVSPFYLFFLTSPLSLFLSLSLSAVYDAMWNLTPSLTTAFTIRAKMNSSLMYSVQWNLIYSTNSILINPILYFNPTNFNNANTLSITFSLLPTLRQSLTDGWNLSIIMSVKNVSSFPNCFTIESVRELGTNMWSRISMIASDSKTALGYCTLFTLLFSPTL